MKRIASILMTVLIISIVTVVLTCGFAITADAATIGDYTYSVSSDKATITKYNGSGGDVVIPSEIDGYPVTSIGDNAFYSCTSLTSVTIDDSVTSIGEYAFCSCSSLTSVTIGDSVTSIGRRAFFECSSLTSVTIGDSVTSIGHNAFYGCSSLMSVTIPDSVTSIGNMAFHGCSSLTSVTIGDSVTSIGDSAFVGCTGITSVEIPGSVTSICDNAFRSCSSLTSISVSPDNTVFYSVNNCIIETASKTLILGCKNSIIPSNGSVTSIGNNAFYECSNLMSVTIPDSVTSIGKYAFRRCTNLMSVTIPDSVTSIGNSAFNGCSSLTSVIIGDSVTSIGDNAFSECSSLTSISVSPDNTVFYSVNNCIIETASKTLILGCKNSIIPSDGSVTSIGDRAFFSCTGITSVTIPDSVTSIGNNAFRDCTGLASVTIPKSVTSIGNYAFYNCTNLKAVYFDGLYSERNIVIGSNNFESAKWYYSNNYSYVIENNEVTINGYGGPDTNLVIPETIEGYSVTSIGDSAFYNCTGLTSVEIPDSVTSIEARAFMGCTRLGSVTIPNSITSINGAAFENCSSLINVYITDIAAWCNISFVVNSNPLTYAKNLYINGELVTDLVIPNTVTSIGNHAFYKFVGLTSVTIPDSVTEIDRLAFKGCTGLKSVTIADSVTTIGRAVFEECTGLTSIIIPSSIITIDERVFLLCTGLTSVTIPDSVISIGSSAFRDCTGLMSVTIGDSVTSIGSAAFYNCTGLTSVTIPDSVTSIGSSAFWGCTGLTSVTIGDSVTSIGSSAFLYCKRLTNLTFSHNLIDININAFNSCWIQTINFIGTRAQWSSMAYSTDDQFADATVICTCPGAHNYTDENDSTCNDCDHIRTPNVVRKGQTLEYKDIIYVKMIYDLVDIDLNSVDLSKDAGLLCWTQDEFAALDSIEYDASHALVGLDLYPNTTFYYGKSNGIIARNLADEHYYVCYVRLSDGTYVYSEAALYGPKTYAYNMIGKENTKEKTKNLCIALLNYATAAQKYFGTEGSELANAGLTEAQKAMNWNGAEEYFNLSGEIPEDKKVTSDTTVFSRCGRNLRFKEMISLIAIYQIDPSVIAGATETGTIFWTAEQFAALNGTPSLDNYGQGTKVVGLEKYSGTNVWCSVAPSVAPKDVSDTCYYILGYVKHGDGSVSYSELMSYTFEQYIYNTTNNPDSSEKMIELSKRLYYYERAAKAALK